MKLPAHRGSLGIMANRQALLTVMEPGVISITDLADRQVVFGTTGGFCEMSNNEATLLCDSLISVEELGREEPATSQTPYLQDFSSMSEIEKRQYVLRLMARARAIK